MLHTPHTRTSFLRLIMPTGNKYAAHSNGTPVNIICLVMIEQDRLVSYTGRRKFYITLPLWTVEAKNQIISLCSDILWIKVWLLPS